MFWSKMKTAVVCGVALVLVGATVKLAVPARARSSDPEAKEIARETVKTYAAMTSYSDTGTVTSTGGGRPLVTTFTTRLKRPALYAVQWKQTGGSFEAGGKVWSDGSGDFVQFDRAGQGSPPVQKMQSMDLAIGMATGVSSSAASTIPSLFFDRGWGNVVKSFFADSAVVTKEKDEMVNGTDCFVITSEMDMSKLPKSTGFGAKMVSQMSKMTTTCWIGKTDHLVRRVKTVIVSSGADFKLSDDDYAQILRAQNKAVTPEAIAELRKSMEGMTASKVDGKWRISGKPKGGEFVSTQTHEAIEVNPALGEGDFK